MEPQTALAKKENDHLPAGKVKDGNQKIMKTSRQTKPNARERNAKM